MATTKAARRGPDARGIERHKSTLAVGLRKQGEHRVDARLLDISRFGFRVDVHGLVPESIVWLKLPDADPQMARVVWSDHIATGCVFVELLPGELFRRTLREQHVEATIIAGPWESKRAAA